MVVIRLVGGLGNQMFQYAAALGLAVQQGRVLRLDVSAFEAYRTWPYQLDCLKVPQDLYTGTPLAGPVSRSLRDRVLRKLKGGYSFREGVYQEPHFHFDPEFFSLTGEEILLDGYFQSPRYFEGAEALLRERFQPRGALTETATRWAAKIDASPCSVSLHVRRGDYLTATASAVHTALDRGYYDRAVALMQDLVGPRAEFFLFSDEPDFIAQVFVDLPRAHVVRSDPSAPWEDMFLMARCKHNIIANSSYSWWGAWLNPSQDKRVIAPARWFTPDKLATCNVLDLYPDDWILLK
ncbi:alpha-1,2-fucosyltransferase [Azovibrio restrictus]|uniref:alpha-1,2-fucosyltransferase n=1 Tax=Azovibrio restrictus TaxID=146938 RepID=UPI0026EB37CD|nr:alpha-1,2-fucosyltransferase [Azovibrio restrictus]